MPLYEYQCQACGTRFEKIRKFSDPPLEACDACGGPVTKLFSSPAIQFKGSGWYITDYAKKSSSDAGKSGSGGSGSSGDSAGSKDSGRKDSGSKDAGSGTASTSDSSSSTTSTPATATDTKTTPKS